MICCQHSFEVRVLFWFLPSSVSKSQHGKKINRKNRFSDSAKNMSEEKAAREKKPVQVRDATCEREKNWIFFFLVLYVNLIDR